MKMRIANLLLALVVALPLAAQSQQLSAILRGSNEVPPNESAAVGIAAIEIDGNAVSYAILVNGLTGPVTAAHIHEAPAGQNGNPVITFNPPLFGSVTVADQALLDRIRVNPSNFYVNVHTSQFAGGEIRGALSSESAAHPGHTVSYLPIAGKTPGQGGTFFVTDVRMVNSTGRVANVMIEFFELNAAGVAEASAETTVVIGPAEQAILNDVADALGVSTLGALRITSDVPVVTIARIINDQRASGGGTAGFAFEGRSLAEASTAGTLPFLSSSTDFRTNLGYFNPLPSPATVTFTARNAETGAVIGSRTLVVPGYGSTLAGVYGVISSVPERERDREDYYVTWSSDAPMLIYASVTDNITGDGVFVQ